MKEKTVYVHVNMHTIRANKKNGTNEPVFIVRVNKSGKSMYADEVQVIDKCIFEYSGNDKTILPCGARVVAKTTGGVWCRQGKKWTLVDPNKALKKRLKEELKAT